MNVSKDSWHYKLVRGEFRKDDLVPTNICPYMRVLFKATIKHIFAFTVVASLIAFLSWCAIVPVLWLVDHYIIQFLPLGWVTTTPKDLPFFLWSVCIGLAIYIAAICCAIYLCWCEWRDNLRHRRQAKRAASSEEAPPKTPSVFAAWLKGIHDKTCTPLEFVDTKVKQ